MATYNYQAVGNSPLPPGGMNAPPPPPPPMGALPVGMMPPQQGMQMMAAQGLVPPQMQPAPPGTHQQHFQSVPQSAMLNPAMNDAPLEFNTNKNKPPMPIAGDDEHQNGRNMDDVIIIDTHRNRDRHSRRDRDRERDRERDRDRNRDRNRDHDRDHRDDRDRSRDEREMAVSSLNGSSQQPVPHQLQAPPPPIIHHHPLPPQALPPPQQSSPQGPPTIQIPNPAIQGPPPEAIGAQTGGVGPSAGPNSMWGGMMGPMAYPMMGMNMNMIGSGMMGDPNMMGMGQMGQYGMMGSMMPDGTLVGPDGTVIPADPALLPVTPLVKEIIHCKSCTLFPPSINAPAPTTRERPPGCRTVFVGGLPENTTEDIIREVFDRCGEITTIRLSKKNFCHIRFVFEASVDAAIYLSGYRVRIGSNTDAPNTGRLHVDYAQARDDLYEWECRQRALQREQRHRERMEQERRRPPSPPPVVHYTDHEAMAIAEKIKADETFSIAVQVVITWLERGDCNKRNANTFYTMIQSTNSHVRRLMGEKTQYEEELQRARELMKGRMQGILIQFGQIERVFSAASHKKVWDHFTKAQRKNIEMWKKQTSEIKTVQLEEVLNERADEEMDVSDEEDFVGSKKRSRQDCMDERNSITTLKEENDSLRCQLEAYKNEVDLVRSDLKMELEQKEKQMKMLQQTLQGMQQQLLESRRRQSEDEIKVRDLQAQLTASAEAQARLQSKSSQDDSSKESGEPFCPRVDMDDDRKVNVADTHTNIALSDKEARLIGLMAIFLHVHPFGAGVDYMWSYLQKLEPNLRPGEIEMLMSRYPTIFRQELSGIGANMERRWQFAGFSPSIILPDNKK